MARLYNDSGFTYSASNLTYNGAEIHARTASGAGAGDSSSTPVVTRARTATGAGAGTSTAAGLRFVPRTATGTGSGTSGTTAVRTTFATGTGSGTGGNSPTSQLRITFATATGTGAGTSNNAILHKQLRTGYGSGGATTGDTATYLRIVPRAGTGTGTGTSASVGARIVFADLVGSGTGGDIAADWIKSLIFRPPAEDDFPFATYLGRGKANRFYGFVQPGARARNVYKLTDGTFTNVDPRNDNLVVKLYLGAHEHFVTEDEKAELVAAGYEVT